MNETAEDQRSLDGRRALAENRQKQAETIEAINGWQHEQWPENATKEELDARAPRIYRIERGNRR